MGKRRMEIEVRLKVPLVVVISRICRSGRRVCLSDCDREHWHKISIEDEANNAVFFFFFPFSQTCILQCRVGPQEGDMVIIK